MRVSVHTEPVNQAFVAALELPVLGRRLSLRSDWTDARPIDQSWRVGQLTPGAEITATVAGRQLTASADEHGTAVLAWDGRDATGAPAGPAVATAAIDGVTRRMRLGRWDARAHGLGGLLVSGYDHLDSIGRRIHLGSGRVKRSIVIQPVEDGTVVARAGGKQQAAFASDGFLTGVTETASGRALLTCVREGGSLRSLVWPGGRLEVASTADGFTISIANRRLHGRIDDDGRIIGLRGPAGGDVTVSWNDGLLSAITDAAGCAHTFAYDTDGRLSSFTRPGRGPTRLIRTSTEHGRRVLVLTAEGRESSYQLDVLPDGTKVRTTRCCGKPPRVTRINGPRVEVEVGDGTRLQTDRDTGRRRTILPSGLTRERIQTATGVTVNGRSWQWARGSAATTSTSPEGRVKGITVHGAAVTLTRAGGSVTLHRDDHGLVTHVQQAEQTWAVEHDDAGMVTRAVRDDGAAVTMQYDAGGWLTGQQLLDGRTIAIGRAEDGSPREFTAPGGGTTRLTMTAPDLTTSIRFGDAGDEQQLMHDADGLVVGFQHGNEPAVSLTRDERGLLTAVDVGDERFVSRSHEHGRPTRATTAGGQVTSVTWDGPLLTSMAQKGIVNGTVHRRYDASFEVDAVAFGKLNAAVKRDRDGLVIGLGPATLERDAGGRVTAVRAGVVAQTWEHDAHGRVTATQVDVHGKTGWRVTYAYDSRGRITTLADSRFPDGAPAAFTYDAAGRLVGATGPFPFSATWDPNSNPLNWNHGETSHVAEFAAGDLLHAIDGSAVAHDGAGRTRSVPGIATQLRYDAIGRLTTADSPTADGPATTRLTRDAFGRVVLLDTGGGEPVRLLPGPHGHPEAIVAEDGTPRMLLVGGTATTPPVIAVEGDRTLLLACDHLGTVRLIVDIITGELVDERVHDHWGGLVRRTGSSGVPFGWGCGLLDEGSGLVHFPARSYSPELLRFLSRDPLLFRGRSTNLYAFADADPVNHGDPTGTTKICRSAYVRWAIPGTDASETWEHWWAVDNDGNELGFATDQDSLWNEYGPLGEFGEARDHGDRSKNAECDEVEDVDDECVAREMARRTGEKLGFWAPGNTCQNFVDDIMSTCAADGEYTVVTDNPDAYDNVYGPNPATKAPQADDGGYTPADGEYTPIDGGTLWE